MTAVRCAFEVVAGVIPEARMSQYSKHFYILSKQYDEDPTVLDKMRDEAFEYAKSLIEPRIVNWVRVDWVYF